LNGSLFGVEMALAFFSRKNFSSFCDFNSFTDTVFHANYVLIS